jgi:hypothetical protein
VYAHLSYSLSVSLFTLPLSEGFFSKRFSQQIDVCIQMISFRLYKHQRSTQVTFDTNQLEAVEEEEEEKEEIEKDYHHYCIDPKLVRHRSIIEHS